MKRERIVTETTELVEPKFERLQDNTEKPTGKYTSTPVEQLVAISAGELKSQVVVNAKGEELGKIEDVMIDLKSGRVVYAVLSFGGIAGLDNKLFAIPWELLCVDNQWNYRDIYNKRIVFNVDKEKLENAPGFDKEKWPSEPDWNWLSEVYTYYGCAPFWESLEEANKVRPPAP